MPELSPYVQTSSGSADPAPALTRGLAVLADLVEAGPSSLDALARRRALPKSSLLRLLEVLITAGAVQRDDSGRYHARMRLAPIADSWPERITSTLSQLAQRTRRRAEWYERDPDGLRIRQLCEPSGQQVRLIAQVGFLRRWDGELEAVNRCAHAHFDPPTVSGRHWVWDGEDHEQHLSITAARALLRQTLTDGWAADATCNPGHVRRLAVPVLGDGVRGVLALAQIVGPRDHDPVVSALPDLQAAAAALSH